ncbi:hypothetical protein ABMA27_010505 [Loxostege sticticalis]|uniref:Peptidase A2 domain-containing protein n=1 Tax=Loxostege sticticalis TaxID=481309 RepID=A0ABR3H5X0_LOXSC
MLEEEHGSKTSPNENIVLFKNKRKGIQGYITRIQNEVDSFVKQQLAALKNLEINVDNCPVILAILLRKLDPLCSREFQIISSREKKEPMLSNLISFLDERALALENATGGTPKVKFAPREPPATMKAVEDPGKPAPACILCKCAHKLFNCTKFKLMPASDRLQFVSEQKLCKICLNKHVKSCRYHFKCATCKQRHNSLIHVDEDPTPVSFETACTQVLLPTAQVKLIANNGTEVLVKALLDSGSQISFVTEELVKSLKMSPQPTKSKVLGIGNNMSNLNEYVQLKLHSVVKDYSISASCFILDRITTKLPQEKVDLSKLVLPPNISLADKDFYKPSEIHILIGADVFFQLLTNEPALPTTEPALPTTAPALPYAQGKPDNKRNAPAPTILNTHFGHVVAGNLPSAFVHNPVTLFCNTCNIELHNDIANLWKTESVSEVFPEKLSEHDTCEELFKSSFQLKNNQFVVDLPLKLPLDSINENLGDSFHLALKRFNDSENRLHKDPPLLQLYTNFIHEYLKLDHGSIIDINQYNFENDPVYFLPHHPVVRMDKKTSKCRTVFDASMKTNKKVSLNDLLLRALDEYIFVTDIRHMFRAINLNEKYRSLQNILWRDSPDKNVECIQLNTVTYGLKSSSYLATRCLVELAEQYSEQFPLAAFILKYQTYVDDVLGTAASLESLKEAKEQLCKLLNVGGFQLHKWSSNTVEVLQDIAAEKQYFDNIELQKDNLSLKTLGINYNVKLDTLNLASPNPATKVPETKREILSFISKFFDPLGLAGPIIVCAKVILQKLWQARINWDSTPDQELGKAWLEFYESLINMQPISIQRYVNMKDAVCVQLIGFADASSATAHGCCIYLRIVDSTGNVKVSLLCSKSRINPLNQSLTIPKLELNAALLLSKLTAKVYKTNHLNLT